MVIFAIPILTSVFTGLIGGVTLHLVNRNANRNNISSGQEAGQAERRSVLTSSEEGEELGRRGDGEEGRRDGEGGDEVQEKEQKDSQQQISRYMCPITHKIINSPAQLLCGHCFQKQPLLAQLKKHRECPTCHKKARFSQIYESNDYKNALQAYKAKRRARKWSRDRLIQDFGDDRFEYVVCAKNRKKSIGRAQLEEEVLGFSQGEMDIKMERQCSSIQNNC